MFNIPNFAGVVESGDWLETKSLVDKLDPELVEECARRTRDAALDFRRGGGEMAMLDVIIVGVGLIGMSSVVTRGEFENQLYDKECKDKEALIDKLEGEIATLGNENSVLAEKVESLEKLVSGNRVKDLGIVGKVEVSADPVGGSSVPSETGSTCSSGGQRRPSWVTDQVNVEPAAKKVRVGMLGCPRLAPRHRLVLGRLGDAVVPVDQHFKLSAAANRSLYDNPAHVVGESHRYLNNKSNSIIAKSRLNFRGDYALSTRLSLNFKSKMECGVCAVRHGLGDGPRVFLVGDQYLPPVVGTAPEGTASCMPTFRIQGADEETLYEFLKALEESDRTWNHISEGSIIFVQSFSMLIDVGTPDRYFEAFQRLKERLIGLYGIGKNGLPKVEIVPAVMPVPISTEAEAVAFSSYLEMATLIKERGTFPILLGPIWSLYSLDFVSSKGKGESSGGPEESGGLKTASTESQDFLTTLTLNLNSKAGATMAASSGAVKVLEEINEYFLRQGVKTSPGEGGYMAASGGGRQNQNQFSRGNFSSNPCFILDQDRVKKLNPGGLISFLGGHANDKKTVKFGVGGLVKLRPQFRGLSWDKGIPLDILEEVLFAWSGEIKSIALSLGREVNSPDQFSMVNGVALLFRHLAEEERARGASPSDPPPKVKDILAMGERADLDSGVAAPAKKDVVLVYGTSNFRGFEIDAANVKVICVSLPGYDYTKAGGEERFDQALEEGAKHADDYWGAECGKHKVVGVILALYGNGSLLCEKKQ